jgi:hypothetical protein
VDPGGRLSSSYHSISHRCITLLQRSCPRGSLFRRISSTVLSIVSLSLCVHSTSDLRAVSLVSHAWLEPAQRCLFSHIIVYSDNDSVQHPSHVYHLRLAFLASRPDLAKFVRSVDCLSAAYKARCFFDAPVSSSSQCCVLSAIYPLLLHKLEWPFLTSLKSIQLRMS